ncbi:hypothetical protein M1293_02270 [Candidatus Parvarchaeota archaeon]|nr:hypothetical protein [Candidatus Parvarchaeota archaeon]
MSLPSDTERILEETEMIEEVKSRYVMLIGTEKIRNYVVVEEREKVTKEGYANTSLRDSHGYLRN